MRKPFLGLTLVAVAVLAAGCTVRTDKQAPAVDASTNGSKPQKTVALDRSNAFIAEQACDEAKLGPTIERLAKFDPHQTWSKQFISDTVAEAKWLKKGEKLQGPLLAKFGDTMCESEIVIVRVNADTFAVRAVCSDKSISQAFQKALAGK